MAELYVVYENHLGERAYQPAIPSEGYRTRRLWREGDEYGSWLAWHYGDSGRPVLHGSPHKAERVARREMRRMERERRNDFREAEHD